MKLFSCSACKQLLFFENVQCERCGHRLAYLPEHAVVSALEPVAGEPACSSRSRRGPDERYRLCANATEHGVCNWAVPAGSADDAVSRVPPQPHHPEPRLAPRRRGPGSSLEIAKRRLLYTLIAARAARRAEAAATSERPGLRLQGGSRRRSKVVHRPQRRRHHHQHRRGRRRASRAHARSRLGEAYRTLLGHFRHEIGHYYWDRLVATSRRHEPFRELFGDERADYAEARERHYAQGAPPDWARTLRQRVRVDASVGGLGRDLRALPAHGRHARDRAQLRPRAAARSRSAARRRPAVTTRAARLRRLRRSAHAWVPLTDRAQQPEPQHGPRRPVSVRADRGRR